MSAYIFLPLAGENLCWFDQNDGIVLEHRRYDDGPKGKIQDVFCNPLISHSPTLYRFLIIILTADNIY